MSSVARKIAVTDRMNLRIDPSIGRTGHIRSIQNPTLQPAYLFRQELKLREQFFPEPHFP
ncbi:MAG: hypothetical protein AAAC47_13755 [Pararhizobium sp.]